MSIQAPKSLYLIVLVLLAGQGMTQTDILPAIPAGAQAVSIGGIALAAPEPTATTLENLAAARAEYENDPNDADNIIWLGRRLGYTGDYRAAITTFSEGIEKHPLDARMYRHRGHRYISIREFDRAVNDLEKAVELIANTENEVEPDGAPNELNIPISSLHGNIWYHLGLAYFLQHDWENALRAYNQGFNSARNADNQVSTTHWRYTILRRLGREEEAQKVLEDINADMDVIENISYHHLCLFYKGEISLAAIMQEIGDSPSGASAAFGVASWHYSNGELEIAEEQFKALTATDGWASFGFIAAEVDLSLM